MKEVTVKLDWEDVDNIIKQQLNENFDDLARDLEKRKVGEGFAIFESDPEADIKEITRHIEALKTVLEFYGCSRVS